LHLARGKTTIAGGMMMSSHAQQVTGNQKMKFATEFLAQHCA